MRRIGVLIWTAICSALIICGAYIAIPLSIGPVPIVLQNLFVMLSGLLLGVWGGGSVAVYLLLGALGLPVFAGGTGGVAHLLGPTGGYLVGFLPAAFLIGFISTPARRGHPTLLPHLVYDIAAVIAGMVVVYGFGVPWLMHTTQLRFPAALVVGVVPFLIGDAIKAALAIGIARFVRSKQLLPREL